jgi:hypothetical protein
VAFFGVNYFDQVKVAWFVLLAMISAATASPLDTESLKDSLMETENDVESPWHLATTSNVGWR